MDDEDAADFSLPEGFFLEPNAKIKVGILIYSSPIQTDPDYSDLIQYLD